MQFFGIWYIIKGFSSIEVVDNIYFFSVHGQWVVKALLLHCPNVWLVPRSQRISLLCVRCSFNPFAPAASPALCPGSDSRSFVCPQPAPDVFAPLDTQRPLVVLSRSFQSPLFLHSNGFAYILRANVAVFWIMATGTESRQRRSHSSSQARVAVAASERNPPSACGFATPALHSGVKTYTTFG